ncbi:hypothetical protein ABK040_013682 [Willaertia magna]
MQEEPSLIIEEEQLDMETIESDQSEIVDNENSDLGDKREVDNQLMIIESYFYSTKSLLDMNLKVDLSNISPYSPLRKKRRSKYNTDPLTIYEAAMNTSKMDKQIEIEDSVTTLDTANNTEDHSKIL